MQVPCVDLCDCVNVRQGVANERKCMTSQVFLQTEYCSVILNTWMRIFVCPLGSHRTEAGTICSYIFVSAVKLHPFLLSFPPIQISPVVFWKGGYIHCYCMISQNLSSQPLKRGRADRSWVIPAVSPSLGKTWVSPTTRTLPSLSYPSTFFLLLHATETILCQLNRFPGHFWGAHTHKATRLFKLTWEYLSWLRPLKINKRTEALSLVKWWDFRGQRKKTITQGVMNIMCWIRAVQR